MVELIGKRDFTSKTYKLTPEKYALEAHIGHIHYREGISKDGAFQDIPTTLALTGETFGTTKASYEAEIDLYGAMTFHNVSAHISSFLSNAVTVQAVPSPDEWGALGKGLIWQDILPGIHQIVHARNGSLTRIFRFDAKPATNEIEFSMDISGATLSFIVRPNQSYRSAQQLIIPAVASDKRIFLRRPTARNHRGKIVDVEFDFHIRQGKLYVSKIIPQTFIDETFTEAGAWLETDDSLSPFSGAADGHCGAWGSTWSTVRGNAGLEAVSGWNEHNHICNIVSTTYEIRRIFFPVNTSGIGAGATVTAATFNVCVYGGTDAGRTYGLTQSTQADPTSLVAGDFDSLAALNSPDEAGTRFDSGTVNIGTTNYNTMTMNSTARGWIVVDGWTKLVLREGSKDIDDSAPTDSHSVHWYMSEETGTTSDPYLYVEYTTGGIVVSKGNTFENDVLALIFNATAIADLAENDSSSPATTLTVALHTATPDEGGTQSSNETAYTGYSRVAVNRNSGGWTVTGNSVSPTANIDFGECSASPGAAITHFSVGTGVSNKMLYYGTVTPNITMAVGVIPRLKTTSTITED